MPGGARVEGKADIWQSTASHPSRDELMKVRSAQEARDYLSSIGRVLTAEETERIWQEIEHHRVDYTRDVSDDELEAVAGGGIYYACVATVEDGSWCWSNDQCTEFQCKYGCISSQYCASNQY